MTDAYAFLERPEGTREAIMKATYHALCEHGYAELTIQRISDHFEKSKSLLYHHYDSKDELLLDFLDFMLSEFEEGVPGPETGDADDRLEAIFDRMLAEDLPAERHDLIAAMTELRAQAANDERYRRHFTRHDRFFEDHIADVIADGIESGVFREVDPGRVAAFLLSVFHGAMTQRVTAETDRVAAVRAELDSYVEATL